MILLLVQKIYFGFTFGVPKTVSKLSLCFSAPDLLIFLEFSDLFLRCKRGASSLNPSFLIISLTKAPTPGRGPERGKRSCLGMSYVHREIFKIKTQNNNFTRRSVSPRRCPSMVPVRRGQPSLTWGLPRSCSHLHSKPRCVGRGGSATTRDFGSAGAKRKKKRRCNS